MYVLILRNVVVDYYNDESEAVDAYNEIGGRLFWVDPEGSKWQLLPQPWLPKRGPGNGGLDYTGFQAHKISVREHNLKFSKRPKKRKRALRRSKRRYTK